MKVLLNGAPPKMKNMGGVANHIHGLKEYWTIDVIYNVIGKRKPKPQNGKYWILWDILKFIFKLFFLKPNAVWINPSITKNSLKRDFLFLRIACFFRVKVVVFIHGFDFNNFNTINKEWLKKNLNKAVFIMVLANDFKEKLRSIGVVVPIEITTTKVEDSLIREFNILDKNYKEKKILFLSRIEKTKGIYETIDAFRILKNEFSDITLQISGTGSELDAVKQYVRSKDIRDVEFTGLIKDEAVKNAYKSSLLYIMPTYYGEGMPTTILEAMAFGLPIITRPVGGIADFFKNGEMGYMTESKDPKIYADKMRELLTNQLLAREMGVFNYNYAKKTFYASIVAAQIESFFQKYIHN